MLFRNLIPAYQAAFNLIPAYQAAFHLIPAYQAAFNQCWVCLIPRFSSLPP
jgi:hypothetical protein